MIVACAVLIGAANAYAQTTSVTVVEDDHTFIADTVAGLGISSHEGIKKVPFSAEVIDETDQVLADGTNIHRERHGATYRDSEGRTRNESEVPIQPSSGEKRMFITIMDPVQRVSIHLDPMNKTATIRHLPHFAAVPPIKPVPQTVPQVHTSIRKSPSGMEDLGTMEIEGYVVTGKRFTHTMATGTIGNDRPLISVHETWISEDLKTALLSKSDSPQSGHHVRKLVNIHTGEPDTSLFQVPPDYTVKDIAAQ